MKKLIYMILILVLLSGCQVKREPNKAVIGIIKVPNDTVIAIQNEWIQESFAKHGYEVEFRFFDS